MIYKESLTEDPELSEGVPCLLVLFLRLMSKIIEEATPESRGFFIN